MFLLAVCKNPNGQKEIPKIQLPSKKQFFNHQRRLRVRIHLHNRLFKMTDIDSIEQKSLVLTKHGSSKTRPMSNVLTSTAYADLDEDTRAFVIRGMTEEQISYIYPANGVCSRLSPLAYESMFPAVLLTCLLNLQSCWDTSRGAYYFLRTRPSPC